MLNRLPRHLPDFGDLLADIGNPSDKAIARAFQVSLRTVQRWHKHGAPRAVCLSLFWLTRWGLSELDSDWHWRLINTEQLLRCLREGEQIPIIAPTGDKLSLMLSKREAA